MNSLPLTGTSALLQILSRYVPDELINRLLHEKRGPGRPGLFSAAQLFRVTLLVLLTPAHSFNLMLQLLAEHRAWRSFAHLPSRLILPNVRTLHEFRARLDLTKLRRINQHLLGPLVDGCGHFAKTVALIDSTDLPAATTAYKKTPLASIAPSGPRRALAAAKTGRVVTLSDIRSTHCGCGYANMSPAFCWLP